MNSVSSSVATLAVVVTVLVSSGMIGSSVAAPSDGADVTSDDGFSVRQAGACYNVNAIGDGTETVESFYKYTGTESYSSGGTTQYQENQTSNLFVYNGSEGYSLVFVHDKAGNSPYGSTISFSISGLPESGTWAVKDDPESWEDKYARDGSATEIDWKWKVDRTDGAAYRGLRAEENVSVSIAPRFNERADLWNDWPWSGDDRNRSESWRFLGAGGETVTQLALDENVSVTAGPCDQTAPSAALTTSSSTASVGESVTFDASGSSDAEGEIVQYRWDSNGDGQIDHESSSSTISLSFAEPGEHTVSLLVRDTAGNERQITRTIRVFDDTNSNGGDWDIPSENSYDDGSDSGSENSSDDERQANSGMSNMSVESVQLSGDDIAPNETVEFTVLIANTDTVTHSETLALEINNSAWNESRIVDSTRMNVSAASNQTVVLSTSFNETGDYNAKISEWNQTLSVSETTDSELTSTPAETASEDTAANQNEATETPTTGADGPGFGVITVVAALLLSLVGLQRRR